MDTDSMRQIFEQYDQQVIGDFISVEKLQGGQGANLNCKLKTTTNLFLLKYCDEKEEPGLTFWLKTIEHLQSYKFQTCYLAKPKTNSSYYSFITTPEGQKRRVAIFQFLSGSIPNNDDDYTEEMLTSLGKSVASLHLVPNNKDCVLSIDQGGCMMAFEIESFLEQMKVDADFKEHQFLNFLKSKNDYLKPIIRDNRCHESIIHTDIFPDNVIFQNNEAWIVDIEEVCFGPSCIDIGIVFISWFFKKLDDGSLEFKPKEAQQFLKAYNSVRKLSDFEAQHLAEFMEYAALVIGFWRFRHFNVKNKNSSSDLDKEKYNHMVKIINLTDELKKEGNISSLLKGL